MTSSSRRVHDILAALSAILLLSAPRAFAGEVWHDESPQGLAATDTRPSLIGVWRPGTGSNPTPVFGIAPGSIENVLATHHGAGEHVRDFERYTVGNEVFYAFVFEAGPADGEKLERDLDQSGLLGKLAENLRLVDLETYLVAGQRRWAALFRGDGYGQSVELDLGGAELKSRVEGNDDWDLEDFEAYRGQNSSEVHYIAVFKPGNGVQKFDPSLDAEQFHNQAHALFQQGYRLKDVETWLDALGNPRFAALWEPGTGADFLRVDRYFTPDQQTFEQLSNQFLGVFTKLGQEQPGLRLIDLEIPWSEAQPLGLAAPLEAQRSAPARGDKTTPPPQQAPRPQRAERPPAKPSKRPSRPGALLNSSDPPIVLPSPLHDSGTEIPP